MDRRAAGALLALAACIASSAAAPTASNQTALDLYEGASEGCYYNFQHYGEGDRIMTNEPCLNCTCHNRMLMCYLRVCPFTKPIGQDCTVEKRADQCCPIVTCPDVPVDLLTSTSTSSPAEYGATGLGKLDKYGCSINDKYFPEGAKVPPTPNKPCEHCYCIRNMTTCVMQECTLHVDGCTPIYHKDVCCPVRYSCDHPEDEVPLLDDMSTTVRPTPGFLLTTTTMSPVTQMTQDCVHDDQIIADGASITTKKACEHCYCMKGDIVCVVQACGAPMENEGKNCTSLPPREGQCCPDTYICETYEPSTELSTESATDAILEKLTTLLPPRRGGVEGSGYRNEPNEAYTEMPTVESELEGSGEEQEPTKPIDEHEAIIPENLEGITPSLEEDDQYIPVTTKAPTFLEAEATTKEIERNVIEGDDLVKETTFTPIEKDVDENISGVTESKEPSHEHVTTTDSLVPEKYDQFTTESGESLNTVPDTVPEKEQEKPHDIIPSTLSTPTIEEHKPAEPQETEEPNISEHTVEPEYLTSIPEIVHEIETGTTEKTYVVSEEIGDKESSKPESDIGSTTSAPAVEEIHTTLPENPELVSDKFEEKDITKPEQYIPSTTSTPLEEIEKLTTEPNHAQNTVDVAEDDGYPHGLDADSQKTTASDLGDIVTEKVIKEDIHEPVEDIPVEIPASESKTTVEPDKGLNTIPSETDEESSSQPSLVDKTTSSVEIKSTELPVTVDAVEPQELDTKSPTALESSSTLSDTHVTKVDQYTITTEPSFRKEDEISFSTDKPKEELASTTIKAEFVDEGLIPTSSHDDKLETGSDITSMDEDMTTMAPEYHKELDETVETKQPTTQSIPEPSTDSSTSPEIIDESTHEVTLIPDVEPHQEPSRIPGEGDCLLNGVTYKNNTVVPSTNNCHTGCKCISSIVKCDPIICSPPPDYMDNCQSIYDTPDSCCPTYICDHPRETIPPQSDNQMSGTEPPMPPPTIECRGDQCELTEPTKPTKPSELCTTDSCVPIVDDKIATQCGPDGCDDLIKESMSSKPPVESPLCTDGKCDTSAEACANGKCEFPIRTPELPPVKPCEGNDCKVTGEGIPASQLCEDGNDCKKTEIPATQTLPNIECGDNGCGSDANLPSPDIQQAPCNEENGCPPQEVIPSECKGDEPCRRVEIPVIEQSPSKCQGSDCAQKTDSAVTDDIHQTNTESSIPEQTSSELGKPEISEKERPEQEIVTEREHATEHYTTTDIGIEADKVTEKASEVQDIRTEAPVYVGTEVTQTIDDHTDELISTEESSSKKPETVQDERIDKPVSVEEQGIQMPDAIEEEQTAKLPSAEETEIPDDTDKDHTDKLAPVEDKGVTISDVTDEYIDKTTRMPGAIEKHTDEPIVEESSTRVPDMTEEYADKSTKVPNIDESAFITDSDTKVPDAIEEHTNEPAVITDEGTKIPDVEGMEYTDKPSLVEEHHTKTPMSTDDTHTDKLTPLEDEGTKTPDVTEAYIDKLTEKPEVIKEHIDEPGTRAPDFVEEPTSETSYVKEEGTKTPNAVDEENIDKSPIDEKQETKIPDAGEEKTTDKIVPIEEKDTEIPDITEKYGDKPTETPDVTNEYTGGPTMIDQPGTKIPEIVIEHTDEPVTIYEEGTMTPNYEKEHSEKQPSIEGQEAKIPDTIDKEHTDELSPIEDEDKKSPDVTEKYTDEPTKIPDVMKEHTDESIYNKDSTTKMPDVVEENINEPTSGAEADIKIPIITEEENLDKLPSSEEHTMKIPDEVTDRTGISDSDKEKPILPEEEHPEKPTDVKDIDEQKPDVIDSDITTETAIEQEDSTENLEPIRDSSTKKPIIIDDGTLDEIEGSTNELPGVTEESSATGAPSIIGLEDAEKPAVVEKDHTSAPVEEEHIGRPDRPEYTSETTEEEGSGTKAPDVHVTGSEIVFEDQTKTELDKVTETPTYEPQTSESYSGMNTESNVEPEEIGIPEVTLGPVTVSTESLDVKEPQPQDSDNIAPTETTPEILMVHEITTNEPLDVKISQELLPDLPENVKEIKQPSDYTTQSQETSTSKHEATKIPEMILTTESVEKITKPTDQETITEQGEIFTDIPEEEPLATDAPSKVIIEPQEGEQPGSPDLIMTGPPVKESATTVFEEEYIKPAAPVTHTTDTGIGYESTSALPEPEIVKVTDIPEVIEPQKTTLPEIQDGESEITPTQTLVDLSEHGVKTDKPDIFTPEREEMITSIKDTAVTEPATSSFTEVEDSFSTGEETTSAGSHRETTEKLEPSSTEKIVSSSVASTSSEDTKITKGPEEPYTNTHEITDVPILMETNPADSDVSDKLETSPTLPVQESITTKSPDLSQETSESSMPSGEPHRRTETTESDEFTHETTEPATNELPVSIVTEPEEKPIVPIDDVASQEENITESPDLTNVDASTVPPEISVTKATVPTEVPEAHITASSTVKEPEVTESSYTEPHITEQQESDIKSEASDTGIEKTTRSPEIPMKPEDTGSQGLETPLPEEQKLSTDYPGTIVEIRTELSHAQVTTEASLSLVTEYQPDIGVTTKEQDYKEPSLHETETKPQEETTEITDMATSMLEVTTSKQADEVSKPADQTLSQAEFSETTPYLIELEEHTHKILEDSSTILPIDEKEHIYESGEVTSTPLPPSKEEHTIAQDISVEEEHLSTVSPSTEEYTHRIPGDTTAVPSPSDELTSAQPETGIQSSEAPSEIKPEEDTETATKQAEIPSDFSEESSTIAGVASEKTTISVPEKASESVSETGSTKPAHEEITVVPPVVLGGADEMDITSSKPTQELEESPAVILTEPPISGSDIEVPTEKEISATEIPSSSEKTTIPEDELIYSTTKATTVKQEDLLTPSSENKYDKPEDKPTSEILPPSSTAELPKPPAEIEPTEEIPAPEDDGHFPPSATGYGDQDYGEEDQAFGPGTCRYGGKVYVSAQQIPRDDPCDFCFCFRSDIICLQQSCPPPIHGCHEEPIQGFCCPRYECPVSMATTVNVTTTTTTTTTTLPPHFPTHSYKGAAQRRGCQIKGHTYKVGEVVRSSSGPCLHCKCGGDGQMKCDPKACTPEPMLRQMIAAAVSAKRRR